MAAPAHSFSYISQGSRPSWAPGDYRIDLSYFVALFGGDFLGGEGLTNLHPDDPSR